MSVAELLHVRMPDGAGMRVNLQLFIASFFDLEDRHGFLIGVREQEEGREAQADRFPDASPKEATAVDVLSSELRRPAAAEGSSTAPSHCDGSSSASSADGEILPIESPPERPPGECTVWFNAVDPDLPILRYTPPFTAVSGPSADGTCFADWIRDGQPFKVHLQQVCNAVWAGQRESGAATPAGELRLRPPAARAAGVEYVADCILSVTSSRDEEGYLDAEATATLTNIRCRRRHRQQAAGRPRCSTRPGRGGPIRTL